MGNIDFFSCFCITYHIQYILFEISMQLCENILSGWYLKEVWTHSCVDTELGGHRLVLFDGRFL